MNQPASENNASQDTVSSAEPAVRVRSLSRHYGPVKALDNVDLDIDDGSYFVLLGPSGGGKTTLLRLIGGFARPTTGRVELFGQDVSKLPPESRPTSMVFQSYALFPHMTVAGNVGYGLKLRKLSSAEIGERVSAALAQVSMQDYAERRPWELSGGQQQRVQLARALVLQPRILLLDEPLAALDAKLRKEMCFELKRLQTEVGITFIHVTHNQEEAMTVADRVAIIADGHLVEAGTTQQIYGRPKHRFTAEFMGERNLFEAQVIDIDGGAWLQLAGQKMDLKREALPASGRVMASVRAESARLGDAASDSDLRFNGQISNLTYLGAVTQLSLQVSEVGPIIVRVSEPPAELKVGAALSVGWMRDDISLHVA